LAPARWFLRLGPEPDSRGSAPSPRAPPPSDFSEQSESAHIAAVLESMASYCRSTTFEATPGVDDKAARPSPALSGSPAPRRWTEPASRPAHRLVPAKPKPSHAMPD